MRPGIDYTGVNVTFQCTDGEGNWLLHKRSQNCRDEQGAWSWGGGMLEFGENPDEAVMRELMEEYGCSGEILERLPAVGIRRELEDGTPTHWISLCYVVRINPGDARVAEPFYSDEIGWFTLDALPTPLHTGDLAKLPGQIAVLRKYVPIRA